MSDLISRQAAIDMCREPRMRNADCSDFEMEIMMLPSAEPKRGRGKWIEYEQEFMLEGSLETVQKTVRECSVCTAKIAGMVGIMNFCPHCGAKMEVDDE